MNMQLVYEVHDTNGTNDFVYANKEIALSIRGLDMYAGCAAHFRLTAHGEILSDRTCNLLTGDVDIVMTEGEGQVYVQINGLSSKIRGATAFQIYFQVENEFERIGCFSFPFYVIFPMQVWNMQYQIQELYRNQIIVRDILNRMASVDRAFSLQ